MEEGFLINGFSKLEKSKKLQSVTSNFINQDEWINELKSYWHDDPQKQKLFDEFSENTISNFHLPFGIAPNFVINGKTYMIPMVIEESSVIAAASKSAKFWASQGGFHSEVISTIKNGQVHFIWEGDFAKLSRLFPEIKDRIFKETIEITQHMIDRGGGITGIELIDLTHEIDNYFQINASFETVDSMGANFINSCLEEFSLILKKFLKEDDRFEGKEKDCKIIMAILSNYTPSCLVKSYISCDIKAFKDIDDSMSAEEFVWKFQKAVEISQKDISRATTHNKGIFNGVDAVIMATGNDYRAVEACGHTYAARDGKYGGLTSISTDNGKFYYELTLPLAIGTVGGLTSLHPLARFSLKLLDNPGADELMMIAASVGLANNFGALKSLTTHGIQIGHMKMHLLNILNHLNANQDEKRKAIDFFEDKKISFNGVNDFIEKLRQDKQKV